MKLRTVLFLVLVCAASVAAQLTTAAPQQAGFSAERLARINTVMKDHVQQGHLAGASGLIARNGKIVFREAWGEMRLDTIVRMYSMTKGVTGVAAMILYDEGKFSLADPVSQYLPEFKDMRVAKESTDAMGHRTYYTVPTERPITVLDLFRHTTGFDYEGPRDEKNEPAYRKLEISGGKPEAPFDLAEMVKRLATAPLNNQPGTTFRYGYSTDVLGRFVEVVGGKPLDQFFEERIFRPLGMKDTAFFVDEAKWNRFAVLYGLRQGGGLQKFTGPAQETFKKKPALLLGGAGLTSTLDDYSRFYQMLLSDGKFGDVRILSKKAVEMMHSDYLGAMPHVAILPEWAGFGLTFAVNPGPGKSPEPASAGSYWWGGAAGTSFWIDPKEDMFGIFLIQVLPPTGIPAAGQFQRLTYSALEH
jgi:CubicO group peptidase (beta-lactamase class C family)